MNGYAKNCPTSSLISLLVFFINFFPFGYLIDPHQWYQRCLDPMETRKKSLEQFQQETHENFEKFTTLMERLMLDVQSLKDKVPPNSSSFKGGPMVGTGSEVKPYLKLHCPRFSGDDPMGWIYQAEQYFDFQKVASEDQVQLASFHFDEIALQWHRWLTKTRGP